MSTPPGARAPSLEVAPAQARPSPIGRRRAVAVLTRGVEAYQFLFSWRPSPCRFVPSCSNYALEALEVHGAWRGSALAVRRLCRCHPWGAHGPDPVPRKSTSC